MHARAKTAAERRGVRRRFSEPPCPRPSGSQRFPKQRRLRKRREFLAVQTAGRATHGRYFLVVALPAARARDESDARGDGRVGITVSKKVGSAVKRNRIKRLVREYLRRHEFAPGRDVVVIAKRSAADVRGYHEVARDLDRLGERLS